MNLPSTRNWQLLPSTGFVDWLAEWGISLLVTTYQVGKLLLVGHTEDGQLSVVDRTFPAEDVTAAFDHMTNATKQGKVLLDFA